jgi:DNA primase
MAIPDEDVAKVRAATDIAALIGEHTSLKRVGRRLSGLCPFHSEKSPSFSVNPEEGLYYCFGCQASGDAISFVRRIEGCDFVEAVERLAARAGITVRNDADGADQQNRGRRQALYDALKTAADYYHERLLSSPEARHARQYLRARGYDGDVVRAYRLGFAPAAYDELVRSKVLSQHALKEAGLAHEGSRGSLIDTFRERVIFPILDPGNRVVALGGRVLPEELRTMPGEPGPKYRNSQESPIYQKRATLYGLNWSKNEIVKEKEAIVCEGYTDVIGFAQAGLPRAVATCGTALTEEHIRLLSRFANRIVLCFDADAAGENAAARLYEWERRHEVELRVAALPTGSDPAELAKTDPAALRAAIEGAQPFLGFRIERALSRADLSSPEGRARAAKAALEAVAEHPNSLVRDQYLLAVADRTHHEVDQLRELLEQERTLLANGERKPTAKPSVEEPPVYDEPNYDDESFDPRPNGRVPSASAPGARTQQDRRAGRDALTLCIHRPDEAAPWFRVELFSEPVQRASFIALASSASLLEAIEKADPAAADLLRRLAMSDDVDSIELPGTLLELVRAAATRAIRDLDTEIRRLDPTVDAAALATEVKTSAWAKGELELLRDPLLIPGQPSPAMDAVGRLLAWLCPSDLEEQ